MKSGAQQAVDGLVALGVRHLFGLPGTQNVPLLEAVRGSPIKLVVSTDEKAAAFMAAGYARATGRLGVVTTIPGPGFAYTLPALAEARADSTPLLMITLSVDPRGRAYALQHIDQAAIAGPLVKSVISVGQATDIRAAVERGAQEAMTPEPGPVIVQFPSEFLMQDGPSRAAAPPALPIRSDLSEIVSRLQASRRPLLFCGQGALGAAAAIKRFVEARVSPLLTTCSGRGLLPETHPLVLRRDFSYGVGTLLPGILASADLVLAIGCKFSHNGTAGFELPLDPATLIHVDGDAQVLAGRYCRGLAVQAQAADLTPVLEAAATGPSDWEATRLSEWRSRLEEEGANSVTWAPLIAAPDANDPAGLFAVIERVLPQNRIIVTDSGLHQAIVRAHCIVHRPRGLVVPADFQSMGFGLPAAIGCKIADPTATVVAVIGDGGLLFMAMELVTAVRLKLDLIVLVFNNGSYGLIERKQLAMYGHAIGSRLENPDMALLAASMGVQYHSSQQGIGAALEAAQRGGVHLIEVGMGEPAGVHLARGAALVRRPLKRLRRWWRNRGH